MSLSETFIHPEWPAPANVKALQTTRLGGVSAAPYDTLNLGLHVGDDPLRVNRNRQSLAPFMPSEPVWMEQVHGIEVANADAAACRVVADASVARQRGSVCVVMTADCLPVLLCDEDGSVVAAAHAGWKGLAAGVIEATVQEMGVAPQKLLAWLGPTIGPHAFEVGEDVRTAFVAHDAAAAAAFVPLAAAGKYRADMVRLARQRLNALGIGRVYGGTFCTYHQQDKFYSYRRDGVTGRMGTFIWLA
ncbi:MAG: peptidoglycan editing factor PgeF [Nitrosomonadales bacterium]|nr:peptidoglycan editing factor PgeF [Nitrosomonadales bacterium]